MLQIVCLKQLFFSEINSHTQYRVFFKGDLFNAFSGFVDALKFVYGLYFIFNIHFPAEAAKTWEMVQRYLAGYDCEHHRSKGFSKQSKTAMKNFCLKLNSVINK